MNTRKENIYRLAMMLLAEGSVTLNRKGGTVKFTNTSEELKRYFKNIASQLNYRIKIKDSKNLVIYSIDLAKELLRLCKNFRTKPFKKDDKIEFSAATFPVEIFQLPNSKIKELLRIYFTCEGGVVIGSDIRNDEVIVRICHPTLRKQILQLLDKINIKASVRGYGLIYIRRREEIEKFAKEIRFIDGVKAVRGKHKGIEKNKLLEFIINSSSRAN